MFDIPFTYLVELRHPEQRRYIFHEYAKAGAKHIVYTDAMMAQTLACPEMLRIFQKELSEEGLSFVDAHACFNMYSDLNCPDEALFPIMLQMHRTELEICAAAGIQTLCIHVGNNAWPSSTGKTPYELAPDADIQHCKDRIKRALEALLPDAERLGVIICIENLWQETNTPEALLEYKRAFPTEALGFCYDAGHAHLMRNEREQVGSVKNCWNTIGKPVPWDTHILDKLLDDVVICHLTGNDGVWDRHRNVSDSDIDWADICGKLHNAPRLKSIQSEITPMENRISIRDMIKDFISTIK